MQYSNHATIFLSVRARARRLAGFSIDHPTDPPHARVCRSLHAVSALSLLPRCAHECWLPTVQLVAVDGRPSQLRHALMPAAGSALVCGWRACRAGQVVVAACNAMPAANIQYRRQLRRDSSSNSSTLQVVISSDNLVTCFHFHH